MPGNAKSGLGPTQLPGPESLCIAHALREFCGAYLAGFGPKKRWRGNLFSNKVAGPNNNVEAYLGRFEFQDGAKSHRYGKGRWSLHVHLLFWFHNFRATFLEDAICAEMLVDPVYPQWIDTIQEADAAYGIITRDSPYRVYVASFYFCTYTLTSVGYGDIGPQNILERTFLSGVVLIAGLSWAYIIGRFGRGIGHSMALSVTAEWLQTSNLSRRQQRQHEENPEAARWTSTWGSPGTSSGHTPSKQGGSAGAAQWFDGETSIRDRVDVRALYLSALAAIASQRPSESNNSKACLLGVLPQPWPLLLLP
ncbi:Kcnh7 [Symbiodinium sp. CCMP2592]|nr:Kcnh7 [Symbiodinium sp. CCMP2592]